MLDAFLRHLIQLSIGLALVAGLLGLLRYRRLPPGLRWLALLAGFDVLMEATAIALHDVLHLKNNLFLLPVVSSGELVLAALAYRQALQSGAFNRAIPWLLSLFSAYALFESLWQFGAGQHAVPLEIITDLFQLGLAGLYFRKLLDELRVERLRFDPFFWLSVGLAVHGLGNLLISLSSNYLLEHCSLPLQKIIFWGVRNVFNMLLYVAYCLALWLQPRNRYTPGQ